MVALIILLSSCKKDDNIPSNPTNGKTEAIFNPSLTYGTMTDQDGNIYKTIAIGTQTWMAENLRTTKYRNGDAIPEVTSDTAWLNIGAGAYCNYENNKNIDTIATYGRLYNWYTVSDNRNIAPTGWHIPSDADWSTLITFLGDATVAGGKLKEIGTTHWNSPNAYVDNSTGFTALPGGERQYDGTFTGLGYFSHNWSSSTFNGTPYYRYVSYMSPIAGVNYIFRSFGMSVRCVRDI